MRYPTVKIAAYNDYIPAILFAGSTKPLLNMGIKNVGLWHVNNVIEGIWTNNKNMLEVETTHNMDIYTYGKDSGLILDDFNRIIHGYSNCMTIYPNLGPSLFIGRFFTVFANEILMFATIRKEDFFAGVNPHNPENWVYVVNEYFTTRSYVKKMLKILKQSTLIKQDTVILPDDAFNAMFVQKFNFRPSQMVYSNQVSATSEFIAKQREILFEDV